MSEGNERNLESVAPEAAENMNNTELKEETAQAAAPAETAEAAKEAAPAKRKSSSKQGAKSKKKRRKGNNIIVTVAAVLVVALVGFGTLMGYGLGRIRNLRRAEQEAEEAKNRITSIDDLGGADPFDAFTEELTGENQVALAALAGEEGDFGGDADVLLGEDALLSEEDPDEESLEDAGEFDAGEPVVVAEFGDGQTLMSDEVLEVYNEQLSMYILSGYSEEDIAETLLDDVMEAMVSARVLQAHAKELGVEDLTDADSADIEAQAKETYDEYLDYYLEYEVDTANMTADEARAAAAELLEEYEGVTYESLLAETREGWWEQKLYDAITADVTLDEAEIQAIYEDRLAEQKESFTEFPEDYEFSQTNGEVIVYNLPGYRAVKVLTLGFEDPETAMAVYGLMDEIAETDGAADAAQQAALNNYFAPVEAKAKEALEQLREGADMDEMIVSMGVDEGMMNEQMRAQGYYVSADSTLWSDEFISAAMELEGIGDYSEPVRTEDGVCILQYLRDVPEGEVPLDDVRDELSEEALDTVRYEAYSTQTEEWLEEANPSYYPERLQ